MNHPVPPRPDAVPREVVSGDRPRASWGPFEALGLFLVANLFLAQIVLGTILAVAFDVEIEAGGADTDLLALSAAVAIGSTALMWLWMRSRHPGWAAEMGLVRDRWAVDARWGAVAGLIVYPVIALGVGNIVVVVLELIFGSGVETPAQIDTEALSTLGQVIAIVYGVAIAPVAEEFFFRGILYRSIADRRGFWLGALVSGTVFGLVHLPWGEPLGDSLVLPITLGIAGVAFAWIYERRQRLVASIAAHMMFNVVGLVLLLALPEVGG